MDFLGSLISAGSNLLGGWLGQQNQSNINQQNIAAQKEFAQQGIQWKVADAKAAGINPLAALGAQTSSFSNVVGSNALGEGVAGAGQDIGRAIQSMQSAEDKAIAAHKTQLDLESMELDNNIKRASLASSLAKATQAGSPPGLPARPWIEHGSPFPDVSYSVTPSGGLAPHMSKEVQDRGYGSIEEATWALRNRVFPTTPPGPPGEGMYWSYNPLTGEWNKARTLPSAWRTGRWSEIW